MRHYTQLTIEQRYQISGLKKAGFNQSKIATDLNKGGFNFEVESADFNY